MKASELLAKVKSGEAIPCSACGGKIPADDILSFVFKLGKLAPLMENANVGDITCVQCQAADPDIKITPRGPDVKFVRGN
ncbi:MAG: hypothetical protein OXH00_24850 [Candidatus Poribacteria bacterium]|nr:hypothetical protein [Candidatus Poribacteria bacterium]